ncbi:unnamed protein product [Jaminaea pallidilutea]
MAVKSSSGDEAPAASTDDKRHGSDTGDSTDGYESGDEAPLAPAATPCWACDQLSPTAECLLSQGQRCLACRQADKPRCNPNKRCPKYKDERAQRASVWKQARSDKAINPEPRSLGPFPLSVVQELNLWGWKNLHDEAGSTHRRGRLPFLHYAGSGSALCVHS